MGYLHLGDQYTYLDSEVPHERKPLRPEELWTSYGAIPAIPPAPLPWPSAGFPVKGILLEPLTAVDPLNFQTVPVGKLSTVVPGNLLNDVYRAILSDADGTVIPYDPSVWVVDGVRNVVTFKYNTPESLGYQQPLSITYWSYTGDIATGLTSSVQVSCWIFTDQKTVGTNGGASVVGTQIRTLNTMVANAQLLPINHTGDVTLVGTNTIRINMAGTYLIAASAPGTGVDTHKLDLIIPPATVVKFGSSEKTNSTPSAGVAITTRSFVTSAVVVTVTPTDFQLRHRTTVARGFGLGLAGGTGTEVYSIAEVIRLL